MKKYKIYLISIIVVIFPYLLISFCTLHIDFRLWCLETRVIYGIIELFALPVSIAVQSFGE